MEIIILPPDRGIATIMLDSKTTTVKYDPVGVPKITYPTSFLEKTKKLKSKIVWWRKEQHNKWYSEQFSGCPKFYSLSKIHKEGTPLRQIASSMGSPLQPLARYPSKQIQPYVEGESYLKNARYFIELKQKEEIQRIRVLVNFDVTFYQCNNRRKNQKSSRTKINLLDTP